MSLPNQNNLTNTHDDMPQTPQPHPSPAPTPSLEELPNLELPETSSHNQSLPPGSLPFSTFRAGAANSLALDDLDDEGTSGTKDEQGGTSLFSAPDQTERYTYAGSAPGGMLGSQNAHKPGLSSLQRKAPLKTLLETMPEMDT